MIQFIKISEMNPEEALALAVREYEMECEKNEQLMKIDVHVQLQQIIEGIRNCRFGKAAVEDGVLVGYLAFWGPWDGIFGLCKGVFSPLGANAFGSSQRNKIASLLFSAIAADMVQEEVYSFALSHYAHDEEIARSFVMNGFGIRCSDAILRLSDYKPSQPSPQITCEEIEHKDKHLIADLFNGLTLHLAQAPCFFPSDLSTDKSWFENTKKRVVVAKDGDKIVGYLALQEEGENYITENSNMYNICGAYVDPDYRKSGVAKQLLDTLVQISLNEGMEYLGVDCETLNPTALRFWGKYFQNYTYSFHRRIDERVHNFEDYFKSVYPEAEK